MWQIWPQGGPLEKCISQCGSYGLNGEPLAKLYAIQCDSNSLKGKPVTKFYGIRENPLKEIIR